MLYSTMPEKIKERIEAKLVKLTDAYGRLLAAPLTEDTVARRARLFCLIRRRMAQLNELNVLESVA